MPPPGRPAEVEWENLSERALWTAAKIAFPQILGLTYREAASQAGVTFKEAQKRMAELRQEIRAQGRPLPPASEADRRFMRANFPP